MLLAVTTAATIYLGWHYVVDDVAGVLIGLVALALARVLTGFELRSSRRLPQGPPLKSSPAPVLQTAEDSVQ